MIRIDRIPRSWQRQILLAGCLFLLLPAGCRTRTGGDPTPAGETRVEVLQTGRLRKIKLLPYWVTTAQFAAYYVGIEKNIFQNHGMDLEIVPYSPFGGQTSLIAEGKVDVALLWLVNALELRDNGTEIVNIAQFSSRSSLMLLTKKSSGIDSLQKMNGRKAGIWSGYELQPKTLFEKYRLEVRIVPIGSTNNLFLMGGVDITNANWFDEYHSIINNGFNPDELNTFHFADYGLNFLEDGVYVLRPALKNNPALCRDFVHATIESWQYSFDHPSEAIAIVKKFAQAQKVPANLPHLSWMLARYRDLYIPKGETAIHTELSRTDYENVARILVRSKLIRTVPPFGSFYSHFQSLPDPAPSR